MGNGRIADAGGREDPGNPGIGFDPLDADHLRDPYSRYRALREADPVHWSDLYQGWVLTRHADVVGVLRSAGFSVDRTRMRVVQHSLLPLVREEFSDLVEALKRVLILLDPPDHTRIRNLVSKAFTPRVVRDHAPRVQKLVEDLLDEASAKNDIDWIADFAYPLPVMVIAEILGVPPTSHASLKRWSDDLGALLDPLVSPELFERGMRSGREMRDFFNEIFEERRATPRGDLVSALVAAEEEGEKLSGPELFATCVVLLTGGHLTTTNLLGNALWALEQNPGERDRLRADPGLMATALEEFLRYDPPIQVTARVATEAHRIDGKTIGAGELAIVVIGAANRDPLVFPNPDRLDLARKDNPHVSFGQGIHACIGSHLARYQIGAALQAFLRRFPRYRVREGGAGRTPTVVSRGFEKLPVTLS